MALQKTLRGFSSFIGLFRGGNFPLDETNQLLPVIEMEDFLNPNKWQLVRTTFSTVNQDAEFVVPEGKFWRCKWISVGIAPPVAEDRTFTPYLRKTFQSNNFILPLLPVNVADFTGAFQVVGGTFGGYGFSVAGLNAEAGDAVGMRYTKAGAGTSSFDADFFLQYQEIDV